MLGRDEEDANPRIRTVPRAYRREHRAHRRRVALATFGSSLLFLPIVITLFTTQGEYWGPCLDA